MKKLLRLIVIFTLSLNLYGNDNISRFGFLSFTNNTLNFKDARDSLSLWIEDLGVSNKLKVDVRFFDTFEELLKAYKNNELDMVVISFPDFYKNKNTLGNLSKDFWAASSSTDIYTQFYLVSLKDKNINGFKDIDNKTLSIHQYDGVPRIWFDKNCLISNKKTSEKILKNIFLETKESTPLLNVFFKKSDLAIVSKETWTSMIQLNPSIEKKIQIIERSEKIFLPFIGFFSKNSKEEKIDMFFNITSKIKESIRGEELLSLLKYDNYFRLDDKYLKNMETYYNEYYDLKEKFD